jgi:hypothetical protein
MCTGRRGCNELHMLDLLKKKPYVYTILYITQTSSVRYLWSHRLEIPTSHKLRAVHSATLVDDSCFWASYTHLCHSPLSIYTVAGTMFTKCKYDYRIFVQCWGSNFGSHTCEGSAVPLIATALRLYVVSLTKSFWGFTLLLNSMNWYSILFYNMAFKIESE